MVETQEQHQEQEVTDSQHQLAAQEDAHNNGQASERDHIQQ